MPPQQPAAPQISPIQPEHLMQPNQERVEQVKVPLEDGAIKDLVTNRFEMSRQAALPFFTKAATYYKLFRNQQQTKNYTGLANLFVPEPYRIISKKTARLANAIKKINVTPETPQDEEASKGATHLINFLRRKLNWSVLERLAIQESRIVGMAWLKVLWDVNRENENKPYKGFTITFDTVDHVILPPDVTMQQLLTEGTPWLIHNYNADLASLRDNPNYDAAALRVLEQRSGATGGRRAQPSVLEQARTMFNQAQRAYNIKQRKSFDIKEYWGYIPIEKTDEAGVRTTTQFDALIVIADKDVVLRKTANPYAVIIDERIPMVPIVARIVGQETYPIGDLEPCESLFNELNDTRNQRMDTVTLNIDPPKEIIRGANIDEKDLVARRGWYIKSNIPNGVRFIPPALQGVEAAIKEEEVIRGDIQQTSGVIDFAPGSNVQAGVEIDTARGALIAKGEADIIAEEELDLLKMSLQKLYRIVLQYSQTFLDRKFTMRIVEHGQETFQDVDKDSIQGNLDLDIEMQTLQDKTTQQSLKLLLLNQARETPGANVGRFFTDALEALADGNIEISEYYKEPQPQPQQPTVSISLKGELNEMQSAQIYKTLPNVDPLFGDPLMTKEGRQIAKGVHGEDLETLEKQHAILNQMQPQQDAQSTPTNSQ